jgi:hypothetical protein
LALSTEHSRLPRLRAPRGDARDAADLGLGVRMVSKPSRSPLAACDAARLAEIDVAGQLAHDQDVEPATTSACSVEAPASSG